MPTDDSHHAEGHALALEVATNPDATEEELNEIAFWFGASEFFSSNPRPRQHYLAAQAVASHPNASLQALMILSQYFPLEVSGNPALTVQLAIHGIDDKMRATVSLFGLAPTRNIGEGVLRLLEQYWYVEGHSPYGARALAQHPDVNPVLLVDAAHNHKPNAYLPDASPFRDHRSYPGEHDHTPVSRAEAFSSVIGDTRHYYDAVAYLAGMRLISLETAEAFQPTNPLQYRAAETHQVVRAYHPDSPAAARRGAARFLARSDMPHWPPSDYPYFRRLDDLPPDAAHVMCLHSVRDANALVALAPDLPELVLRHLLWDNDPVVRAALALNPTTPAWAIAALLDDTNSRVRATAKLHPHAHTSE